MVCKDDDKIINNSPDKRDIALVQISNKIILDQLV